LVRRGPSLRAAFDDQGRPTKAALGFARSCGVDLEELTTEETPKGSWLSCRQEKRGAATKDLVLPMVEQALSTLPIPKRMRWGDGDEEFVRPVHWAVVMFGDETLSGSLFGVDVGFETRGHRFHCPTRIRLGKASEYAAVLESKCHVEPSFGKRRDMIRAQVESLAAQVNGQALIDEELLDEVTGLCEWPKAVMGSFDDGFLEVPPEVLIETMQKHQKYFALRSSDGQLLPRFITISNIESLDEGQVRSGNERVIRPRFSDAAFFWTQDLKRPLEAYAPRLKHVVFQKKLGSLAEKSSRVSQISRHLAGLLGLDEELAARAAHLGKCDLMTQMIFEFGSLQGIMGRYYAQRSGEDPCLCAAMEEQYLPRHAGDRLPESGCGQVLSIADKLDTLVGIFAIGERPSGVKDPYALRRASIGLLRILIETPIDLDLREILDFAAEELREKVEAKEAAEEVFQYVMERLKGYYHDKQIGSDIVDAVLSIGVTKPSDIDARVFAVQAYLGLPEAASLTAANKRIRNILRKSGEVAPEFVDPRYLVEGTEKQFAKRLIELQDVVACRLDARDYEGALAVLASLRGDVDAFFNDIMVMVNEPKLRSSRLGLLRSMEKLFLGVADISRLQ
jgi:glycyl-tRNA synthetase beta chain